MTYRDILIYLHDLTDEQLEQDATIYYERWDTFFRIERMKDRIKTPVLEDEHVVFIVK
jgi:hypothetical protein